MKPANLAARTEVVKCIVMNYAALTGALKFSRYANTAFERRYLRENVRTKLSPCHFIVTCHYLRHIVTPSINDVTFYLTLQAVASSPEKTPRSLSLSNYYELQRWH